ncbi:hypothetical protein C8J56DRAFT_115120 [Mycena floridula]|nr:hypothetical protein C8J56DRAFT_115120 [Mycena floridula]
MAVDGRSTVILLSSVEVLGDKEGCVVAGTRRSLLEEIRRCDCQKQGGSRMSHSSKNRSPRSQLICLERLPCFSIVQLRSGYVHNHHYRQHIRSFEGVSLCPLPRWIAGYNGGRFFFQWGMRRCFVQWLRKHGLRRGKKILFFSRSWPVC